MARLQSHVWVSAFIRSEAAAGGNAVLLRRGNAEAGAIFVVQDHLDGTLSVYGPAPQSQADADPGRSFELAHDRVEASQARDWLERQVRFDPDCWIVETERREGAPTLV